MENISEIIVFLILLYCAWSACRLFSKGENEHKNKFTYIAGKLFSLFLLVFFISVMEKMLFYSNVDTTLSLKFSALVVLAYSIGIFVKKKLSK